MIKMIVVHHSATVDGDKLSWGAIRRCHTVKLGWADIGYHAGIEVVRGGLECLYGRPTDTPGAHVKGRNKHTLGFCFVGNYDDGPPSDEMLRMAARVVLVPWMKQHDLRPLDVVPHRLFAEKTCPGLEFDMERLREVLTEIGGYSCTPQNRR